MKIVSGNEPLFCDESDESFKVMTDIASTTNDAELMDSLRRSMPLKFEAMVQLADWKAVLNKLDQRMCNILHKWRKYIILTPESSRDDEQPASAELEPDVADLRQILCFTSHLLRSSINKEVYNSAEFLVELLCSFDDELMFLALDALLALAVPPLSHRCNLDMIRHITSLHKNVAYFDALFEIIEASVFACTVPVAEFLSTDFTASADMRRVKVDFRTRSKYLKNILVSDSNGETQEIEILLRPENSFEIDDVWENQQSLRDIVLNNAAQLTFGLKFSLMCAVRVRRLLQSREGRTRLMHVQYQSATILLGCHPDAHILANYFEDKIGLIKNFMYLLRTGPGSLDYRPDLVPLDTRLLACQCLESIVGSRDNSSVPIFARYPWIVQDLGLNRGQYMGMIPCMVRAMTSYLASLDSTTAEDGSGAHESKMDTEDADQDQDQEMRLVWMEHVFMLLIAIVNIAAALPALTDNGLVGSVLQVLESATLCKRSGTLKYVQIMCIETLESAVTSHSPAMVSFKEKNGMEIAIGALHRELVHCLVDNPPGKAVGPDGTYTVVRSSAGTLPAASSIVIQEFFSLLTSVLQEDRGHTADRSQWYKLPALAHALRLIFANAQTVGSLVLSPAVSLLAEIINSDPAPPTILSYMLNSNVSKDALRVLTGHIPSAITDETSPSSSADASAATFQSQEIIYSSDLMLSLLCLLSSLSLTADGIAQINAVNPFRATFSVFYNPKYVYPQSRIIMGDLPNMMGTNLEELVRHYPAYTATMVTELVSAMNVIIDLAEPFVGPENYRTGALSFSPEFEQVLHYSVGILLCLEALLMNKQTIDEFQKLGGFACLGKFLRIAFGPPRYLMDAFACTIDSTVGCIGYTPLVSLVVSRCMNRVGEIERKYLTEAVIEMLESSVDAVQADLRTHADAFGAIEVSKQVPATLGGNGNPLLEGFLDTVTRDPVQDCCEEGKITDKLLSFARVLRGFAMVDCLVDALGIALKESVGGAGPSLAWPALSEKPVLKTLLNQLYIPTQLEMARARGIFLNSSKDSCVKVHPVYHLIVIAAESVAVRESMEDNSNRVCKLGRGCIVEAYERRCVGTGGILKYRTKDGWIGVYRNAQSTDPQVLVVRTSRKSADDYAEEVARNQSTYEDSEKRFEFEKFANISAKRGGFLALYHFNHSVKSHLLSVMARNLFVREAALGIMPQETCTVSPTAATSIPLILGCIRSLVPDVPNATPKNDFDLEAFMTGGTSKMSPDGSSSSGKGAAGRKSRFARGNAAAAASSASSAAAASTGPSFAVTSIALKESYFQQDAIPLLDEFPTSLVYVSIRLAELTNSVIFEHRRGRLELNPLVVSHLIYDSDCLERTFSVLGKVFLCGLPDLELETVDKPEHRRLYAGAWYPLKEVDLDRDPEDAAPAEQSDSAMVSDASAADAGKASKAKGKGKGAKSSDKTDGKKESQAAPFPSYLAYRRALRERRLLSVSSIDNTINLWKLLCSTLAPAISTTERALQREATDERDYDPYAMKRLVLTTMTKYLVQLWSHRDLHLLPPTSVKNVIDLMAVVIKALNDMKGASSLRAPALHTSQSTGGSSAGTEAQRFLSRLGSARRISAAAQAPAAAPSAPVNEFAVSEDCINTLQEMGFTRRAIVRAATMLRSNNANHLVPHLLENPFYFNEPEPAAPARSSTSSAPAAAPASNDAPAANATESSSSAPATASAAAASDAAPAAAAPASAASRALSDITMPGLPPPLRTRGFSASLSGDVAAASAAAASASSATDAPVKVNPLPLIPKQLDVMLKLERDLLQRILKCIYGDVPMLCVGLIERGPSKHLALLDVDMKNSNSGITRELFTVMVLNQMLKCLEKNILPEGLLRIVQLSWLYHRAVAILRDGNHTTESMPTLSGVLHAILVLLTSKMYSATTRTHTSCNELLFLIFTLDDRYSKLYPLMVEALEKVAAEGVHTDTTSETAADGEQTAWIAPALLILDIAAQPILVDPEALRVYMNELDGYVKYNPQSTLGEGAVNLSTPDDSILTEQVRAVLAKNFLRRKPALAAFPSLDDMLYNIGGGPQRRPGRSFDGLFDFSDSPVSEAKAAITALAGKKGRGKGKAVKESPLAIKDTPEETDAPAEAPLPLFDTALSMELKMRCLSVAVSLLRTLSSGKSENAAAPQAAMQLIAHLTRHPSQRKVFHDNHGGVAVLRCKTRFDGMPSVVFTLLQQVLEDERYLTQSMSTAVRLCLLRLSERKSKSVLLKSFMEVICPVVFREQALFMKVLKEHTVLKTTGNQVYISWKDPVSEDKVTASTQTVEDGASSAILPADAASAPAAHADKASATSSAPAAGSATKRQRLQDGTAVATSVTQSATKPAAPTSGLKSGAKRLLSAVTSNEGPSSSAPLSANVHSATKLPFSALSNNEAVNEVVDELLTRIVCKWLEIKTMDKAGQTALSSDPAAVDTSLSIEDMLIIAADLIAAQPAVSISVMRYVFNVGKVPAWAKNVAKAEFPVKHAVTGASLGGLFFTFVVHALLLPPKLVSWDTEATTGLAEENAKLRVARDASLAKLTGASLRNACSYFLASLASRPGDSRKRILTEVLNGANVGSCAVSTTNQLRSLVAFAETMQYLLNPPQSWVSRDAFILPAKDIMTTFTKLNAHARIAAAICSIDMAHPLALDTIMLLAVPLDGIIKRGLEPTPPAQAGADEPKAVVARAFAPAPSDHTSQRALESNAVRELSGAVAGEDARAAAIAVSSATTATPTVRRTAAASSSTTAAPLPDETLRRLPSGDASRAFITPAVNRRRGNTEQSFDTEERQLLQGDQHEHLIRPASYRHESEDEDEDHMHGSGHEDDEDGDAEDDMAVEAYLDTEGLVEGEEGSEDEDGDDDDDESDEDATGGHHHHHHHHHGSDDESEEDSDADSGAEDADSHIDSHSDGNSAVDDDEGSDGDDSDGFEEEEEDDEDQDDDDFPLDESHISMPGLEGSEGSEGEEGDEEDEVDEDHDSEHSGQDEEDGDHLEELDALGEDEDEDIDDDEADMDDDDEGEDDEGDEEEDGEDGDEPDPVGGLSGNSRTRRHRSRRGADDGSDEDEDEDAEHQGEGDDDEGDEADLPEDGDDVHMDNEHSMDFGPEEDGEIDYDAMEYAAQIHGDENGDAEEDGAGMMEDDEVWTLGGGARGRPSAPRFRGVGGGDGEEFVAGRGRGHDRSRRQSHSHGGMAGMAQVDLQAIINNLQNQRASGSGVFSFPAGAVISGGVLETQDENGGGETIAFDQSGGLTSRRQWTRNADAGAHLREMLSGAAAGGDVGANINATFQDLLSNMLPPNMSMTSSTARIDPRTGALTLSFGGTRTDGAGGAAHGGAANPLGATAVQPPAHPLLAVTDARRNRFLQPCVNGLAATFGINGRATSFSRSIQGMSLMASGGASTLDASNRRGQLSVRRREVGPIVSDRRWGTDIGDLEPAGARLAALTSAVETALGDVIEKEVLPESRSRAASIAKSAKDSAKPSQAAPVDLERIRYESDDFDEDDGSDAEGAGSDDAEARNASRMMDLGYDPNETKEEEGELQETKENEPEPAAAVAQSSSSAAAPAPAPAPSVTAAAPAAPVPTAEQASAMDVEAAAPSAPVAVSEPVAAAAAPAPAPDAAADSALNLENLQFVESLSYDLRQEVLVNAEEDFLRSLPVAIQNEARTLRELLGLVDETPPAPAPVVSAPVAPAAPAPAAPIELDFGALMGRLMPNPVVAAGPVVAPQPLLTSAPPAVAPRAAAPAASAPSGAQGLLMRMLAASTGTSSASTGNDAASSGAGSSSESGNPSSSATSAPAAPVVPAVSAEARKADELAMTVPLGEDRADVLPYGAHLLARLLRTYLNTNKSKPPRSIAKLLATACRYKNGRRWIVRAMFGTLTHGGQRVADCLLKIPLEQESPPGAFEAELQQLQSTVDQMPMNIVNIHRIITGLGLLFRRSDKLAWYEIMLRPEPEEDSVWLFGSLIALLGNPLHAAGESLEYLLQVMEELSQAFAKLTVKQANDLAADAQRRLDAVRQHSRKSGRTVTYASVGAPLDSIPENEDDETPDLPKRRRLEPASPEASDPAATLPGRARAASIDIEGAQEALAASSAGESSTSQAVPVTDGTAKEAEPANKRRVRMPFPVLQDAEVKLLCQVAGSAECTGNSRKRLMRVMRFLSLCDHNWMLFLDNLAAVGADLAARATLEFSDLHNTLVDVVQNNETAAAAMARPELSTPKSLSEVRLLNVLRIMTALRSRSSPSAATESEVVAAKMRRIQAGSLWDTLCDCLDIVRDLEGITDMTEDQEEQIANKKDAANASGGHAAKPEDDQKVALSSLTLRFMPLIECFLSVCATTMLVRPDSTGRSAMNDSQRELERLSSGFKRRHSRDEQPPSSSSSSLLGSSSMRAGRMSPATPSGNGGQDLTSPATFARVNSMLPGSRFRQHASYFQMQMELSDESAAQRLVNFTRQNRVLFNNVLRNNVSLLEGSFSPLVSVPKCRQMLHFDIKRSYFKLKLKRMRQTAARSHGSLRLSVRRSGVFEESFQALRYKTADEMRRRLSVNFHGEEGMDAGGLTREWYGVLAREIFNPNYALFTSTGDNVTFQPNAQSYINPDHQSYFKFVGRVIGKAICDGQLLDAHFTRSFYKHILGLPVSVVDLEAIDPEYFKSLKQILNTPLDLMGLDLTFSAETNDFGVVSIVDLIPQGRDVPVTDDTKHEYVKLLAHHRMTTAIRKQIDSFLEGFHELVPSELISIFDAQELELLISGLPDIDLDDLRAHTEYQGYKPTDPEIGYFWNVLKSFSKQEKALFLQFVTGTSKVPLDGFKALQGSDGVKEFNICKAFGGSHLLPAAHTCFNQLDLPEYPTEEVLREKLLIAIREGSEGFGFA